MAWNPSSLKAEECTNHPLLPIKQNQKMPKEKVSQNPQEFQYENNKKLKKSIKFQGQVTKKIIWMHAQYN